MILSMTGFGEAQLEEDAHCYHLEIRSVNSRYFKASIRVPETLAYLESEIERDLRRRITRGSLTVRLYIRDLSEEAAYDINAAAIRRYVGQLRTAASDDPSLPIDLATLATLPGVCQPPEMTEAQRKHHTGVVSRLLDAALDKLLEMRAAEGRVLADDLRGQLAYIGARLDAIGQRVSVVVDGYRERLMSRIQQLIAESGVKLAEEDLLKEVAIYAERSDISEEMSRLAGHVEHFTAGMASPEPAGRKLEFIAQEMLREANTMGSKAGDAEIGRHVIDIKGAIDRIKEQVQNAE